MKKQLGTTAALVGFAFLLGTAVVGCEKDTTTAVPVPVAGAQGAPGAPGVAAPGKPGAPGVAAASPGVAPGSGVLPAAAASCEAFRGTSGSVTR